MSQQWYCRIDGTEHGPLSPLELKHMANDGSINPETLVRTSNSKAWTVASKVRGLVFTSSPNDPTIQILYEKSDEPVAAFVRKRQDDCLSIADQKLLRFFCTAIKIHGWARVRLGEVEFLTVSSLQTLPLKSPQLKSEPLIPFRSDELVYLDGPREFMEKVHIICDTENDQSHQKFLRPGFYFSARFGKGTPVSYLGKIWIVPNGCEKKFLTTLKCKGAEAFATLESFPDPTSKYMDEGGVIRVPGDRAPAKVSLSNNQERASSSRVKLPLILFIIVAGSVGVLLLFVGLSRWVNNGSETTKIGSVAALNNKHNVAPQNVPLVSHGFKQPQSKDSQAGVPSNASALSNQQQPMQQQPAQNLIQGSAVDNLMNKIDREAAEDLTEWIQLRDDFYKDKSVFSAMLCLGSMPPLSDELAAIKKNGEEAIAVERLRGLLQSIAVVVKGNNTIDPSSYYRTLLAVQLLKELAVSARPALPELQLLLQTSSDPLVIFLVKQANEAINASSEAPSSIDKQPDVGGYRDDEVAIQLQVLVKRLPPPSKLDAPQRFMRRIEGLDQKILDSWANAFQPALGFALNREEAFQFLQEYDYAFTQDRYQSDRGQILLNRLRSLSPDEISEWCKAGTSIATQFKEPGQGEREVMIGLIIAQDDLFQSQIYDRNRSSLWRERLSSLSPRVVRELAAQIKPSIAGEQSLTIFELELAMSMLSTECLFKQNRLDIPSVERAISIAVESNIRH